MKSLGGVLIVLLAGAAVFLLWAMFGGKTSTMSGGKNSWAIGPAGPTPQQMQDLATFSESRFGSKGHFGSK